MIHEHDALELASAAIDFPLTEAESETLREAVADCPICAERASVYRRHARLLADLPGIEASATVRRRVLRASVTGQRFEPRTPMLLLAAALLLGALLAVAAAVGGVFQDRDRGLLSLASPGPSAPAQGSAPSGSPTTGASPPPAASGGGTGTPLARDAIADVVANNVRIRSQPRVATDSFKLEPLLKSGDRLFVISGPVVADNYDWYEVAAWRPSSPSVGWPIGWVARADHDGTPWIQAAALTCPSPPSLDSLVALDPHEALACFGREPLTLRAFVSARAPGDGCQVEGAVRRCIVGPTWLTGTGGRTASASGAPGLDAISLAFDPQGPVAAADLPVGRMSVIEGAFDHPAASGCVFDGYPSGAPSTTGDDAILQCRMHFAVSAVTPDGTFLLVDKAAVTTTTGLRVRSRPMIDATSQKLEPLLDRGTHLFVLQGPVAGSGYDWYEVIAPAVARVDGGPMVGWIAVADKTGEPWAQVLAIDCPSPDGLVRLADVHRLATGAASDGGLSCFGGRTITTSATVHVDCGTASASPGADWLSSPSRALFVMTDGGLTLEGRLPPDQVDATCRIPQDVRWNIEGHFDDPDSASCGTGSAADPNVVARYRCRTVFVVTMLLR